MAKTVKFTCDRCGQEADRQLPAFHLGSNGGRNDGVHIHRSRDAEFCQACENELQGLLKAFHRPWVYLA